LLVDGSREGIGDEAVTQVACKPLGIARQRCAEAAAAGQVHAQAAAGGYADRALAGVDGAFAVGAEHFDHARLARLAAIAPACGVVTAVEGGGRTVEAGAVARTDL